MPGRLQVPDAAPLLDSWEKRNSWRCRGCCRSGAWPLSLLCVGGRCGLPPVPVLSPWLPSVASGSPLGGVLVSGSGVLGVGVSCLFPRCQEAGGSFCAGTRRPPGPCVGGCLPWRGFPCCGAPPGCCFPRPRSILQHTGAGDSPSTTWQQALTASPQKEKLPWKPRQTRCRRCRASISLGICAKC